MGMVQPIDFKVAMVSFTKIYSHPFLPKARRFHFVNFVASGSRQVTTASPLDALLPKQTRRVNNSG
jgi:hypothetical protein